MTDNKRNRLVRIKILKILKELYPNPTIVFYIKKDLDFTKDPQSISRIEAHLTYLETKGLIVIHRTASQHIVDVVITVSGLELAGK